ncbi:hypothetical protein N8T08_000432 [Aspergillus melleus]|uniref:Uncharacterized protein n=1 Tax=Aspergillus melleus TaxID=138277 RepID=A0ACC3BBE1_9EURO|nr:hypothetical protein N8T08_000432 [Aspergillus melleus]
MLSDVSPSVALATLASLGVTIAALWLLFRLLFPKPDPLAPYPLLNGRRPGELSLKHAKQRFVVNGNQIIIDGFKLYPDGFRIQSDDGIALVLPPRYAESVGAEGALSVKMSLEMWLKPYIPGMEPYRFMNFQGHLLFRALRSKLSRALVSLFDPLAAEADVAIKTYCPNDSEWQSVVLKKVCSHLIAQCQSRAFVGQDMCRHPEWLHIMVNYSSDTFMTMMEMRLWPKKLLPLVHWFLPGCQKIRAHVRKGGQLLADEMNSRQGKADDRRTHAGKVEVEPEPYNDLIEWMDELAEGHPYDRVTAHLALPFLAVHNASMILNETILLICQSPQLMDDLRREIERVIPVHGWDKASLTHLELMDAVFKETIRLKSGLLFGMQRVAREDVVLKDGTFIPEGTYLNVASTHMRDNSVFPDGKEFNPYRYVKMRAEGQVHCAHLVATTVDHLGFGMGRHSCPGRFFAVDILKIVLCKLLLRYDIKPGEEDVKSSTM